MAHENLCTKLTAKMGSIQFLDKWNEPLEPALFTMKNVLEELFSSFMALDRHTNCLENQLIEDIQEEDSEKSRKRASLQKIMKEEKGNTREIFRKKSYWSLWLHYQNESEK